MKKYFLLALVISFGSGNVLGFECKTKDVRPIPVPNCEIRVTDVKNYNIEIIEHPLRGGYFEHCPGVAASHKIGDKHLNYKPLEVRYEAACTDLCGYPYSFGYKGLQDYSEESKLGRFSLVAPLKRISFGRVFEEIRSRCPKEGRVGYQKAHQEVKNIENYIRKEVPIPDWTHELWPNTPLIQETVVKGAKKFKYRDQGNSLLVEIKHTSEAAVYYVKAVLANEKFSQLRYPIEMGPGLKKQLSVSVGEVWALEEDQSFAAHTSIGFQLVKNEPVLKEDEIELMSQVIKKIEKMGIIVWEHVLFEGKSTPVAFNGSGEMLEVQVLVPLKEAVGFDIHDYIVIKEDQKITFKRVAETPRVLQFASVK